MLGLERAGGDLDAAYKFLDAGGSKLDYRRYGEVIFDVLIAGGLLREYLQHAPSIPPPTLAST